MLGRCHRDPEQGHLATNRRNGCAQKKPSAPSSPQSPKGNKVAVFRMGPSTEPISGNPAMPYIDPYDNTALISLLDRLENLEAKGGADLAKGLRTLKALPQRPSSLSHHRRWSADCYCSPKRTS